MNLNFRYLFNLDQKVRIYLRFFIETAAMSIVYVMWLASVGDFEKFGATLHVTNMMLWVFLYKFLGLQKDRIRFSSLISYFPVLKLALIVSVILAIEHFSLIGKLDFFSFLFVFLATLNFIGGLRVIARQVIRSDLLKYQDNILVYGTSDSAIDLVNAMAFGKKYKVVGFVSDTPMRVGSLAGLPVIRFDEVESFALAHNCKLVVLASQTTTITDQTEILLKLDKLGLSVGYAPTIDRAFDYEVQLKAVKPEEVLGRVSEIQFDASIHDELVRKTILVTGAGGSIGSEICRQIARYKPDKLVVLELNEFALYSLEQELSSLAEYFDYDLDVAYYLGSVTDEVILSEIFEHHNINIVYHAAAYKHVPIVEDNVIAGINNNVFGTKTVAKFAHKYKVTKFVLVSTDKAVRPTNVMGATKRLAELVIQDFARSSETIFTMVRFGNVLGSSGSVIPKFKTQINSGGPITVTHAEITRYFMSIPEAAHLVIHAGTFAEGGEVFLLDMGDPVKIVDLAKSMIRQHGLQPVFHQDIMERKKQENEILIEFSGLRPGEKLYEELLIEGTSEKTKNPKIFRSEDGLIKDLNIEKTLSLLEKKVQEKRVAAVVELLLQLPISYQPVEFEVINNHHDKNLSKEPMMAHGITLEQQPSKIISTSHDKPSFFQKIVSSKIGMAMLHLYFLLVRGMTLGVRIMIKNQSGEILLVKHTYVAGWHLPGGGVDHGEDIHTAARREIFEETGISEVFDLELVKLIINNNVSKRDHVSFFTAQTSQSITFKKTAEIVDVRFFSSREACDIVSAEYREFIAEHV